METRHEAGSYFNGECPVFGLSFRKPRFPRQSTGDLISFLLLCIAKLVFDDNIKDYELNECLSLAKKYNIQIILQPKMDKNTIKVSHEKIMETFNYCSENYHQTRLIGQVHKFFDIR